MCFFFIRHYHLREELKEEILDIPAHRSQTGSFSSYGLICCTQYLFIHSKAYKNPGTLHSMLLWDGEDNHKCRRWNPKWCWLTLICGYILRRCTLRIAKIGSPFFTSVNLTVTSKPSRKANISQALNNRNSLSLWRLVLIVRFTQSGITWEEPLSDGLSRSGWPVGVSVGDCFNYIR